MNKTLAYFDLERPTERGVRLEIIERIMSEMLLQNTMDAYLSDEVEAEPEKPVIRGDIED